MKKNEIEALRCEVMGMVLNATPNELLFLKEAMRHPQGTIAPTKEHDPKPTATPKAVKGKGKAQTKSEEFDYGKYIETATKLGCMGEYRPWKGCRQIVYAVMDGTKTLAQGKKDVQQYIMAHGWA